MALDEVAGKKANEWAKGEQSLHTPDTDEDMARRKESAKKTSDDLGPTLPRLRWCQRIGQVIIYAFKHQKLRITITGIFILLVLLGVLYWSELQLPLNSSQKPGSIVEWLLNAQTILGMGTLLVALFVWVGEIEKSWEEDLPKRLSVFFFWKEMPIIVCRYVWLAGKDEIRTWGQQVGVQAQDVLPGERPSDSFLHFEPDMQTRSPELLIGPDGNVWKHYSICFKLTDLNKSLKRTEEFCRYQNVAGKDKKAHNFPLKLVESIPEVSSWKQGES